jgi:hypothetical protein
MFSAMADLDTSKGIPTIAHANPLSPTSSAPPTVSSGAASSATGNSDEVHRVVRCPKCKEPCDSMTGHILHERKGDVGLPVGEKPCFPCFLTKPEPGDWDV